jgi:hypothetical protein
MNFSLFVVFEGSRDLGPVPLCRIADQSIIKDAIARALENASRKVRTASLDDEVVHSEICRQEEYLRDILAMI